MKRSKTLLAIAACLGLACGLIGSQGIPSPSPAPKPSPLPSASSSPVPMVDLCLGRCVMNPAVTQATIGQTICRSGWTKTIRPAPSYTDALKLQQMQAFGLVGTPADYEEDHRLPLELGGDPRNPHNLSPEPHPGSSVKDRGENTSKGAVCKAHQPLADAQKAFIASWLGPWPQYLR